MKKAFAHTKTLIIAASFLMPTAVSAGLTDDFLATLQGWINGTHKHAVVMDYIYTKKINVNGRDSKARTPLMMLAEAELPEQMQKLERRHIMLGLIQKGADVNAVRTRQVNKKKKYYTDLGQAADSVAMDTALLLAHDKDAVEVLIDQEANINATNEEGSSLHAAIQRGDWEVAEFLIEKGIDVKLKNDKDSDPKTARDILQSAVEKAKQAKASGREVASLPRMILIKAKLKLIEDGHKVEDLKGKNAEEILDMLSYGSAHSKSCANPKYAAH